MERRERKRKRRRLVLLSSSSFVKGALVVASLFLVLFVLLFFFGVFRGATTTTTTNIERKKERRDGLLPPRRALTTRNNSINSFRLNTFNVNETFPRRFFFDSSSPPSSNETEAPDEVKDEEEEEFLAKLLDAFVKQNSALYDAKMKGLSGTHSSSSNDDAFVSASFPLQRLRRVEACEPRCDGEFRRTGGFGLLPQFIAKAEPNWDNLENRWNASMENAREFFADFAKFYVEDEDEEDDVMKTALKLFNGLVTAKDDRLMYNGMNNNINRRQGVLAVEEKDVIRKSMIMGKEMQ
jgi:hypothetical protein